MPLRDTCSRITITNIDLHPAFLFNFDVVILGFLFLVFAAILTRGHQLEEEQSQFGLDAGQT